MIAAFCSFGLVSLSLSDFEYLDVDFDVAVVVVVAVFVFVAGFSVADWRRTICNKLRQGL